MPASLSVPFVSVRNAGAALDASCTGKVADALERKVAEVPDAEVYSIEVTFRSEVTDADAEALGLLPAHSLAAIGAVGGGLVGNQIGSGKGQDLATIGGAIGGGYLGKEYIPTHNTLCP